MPPAPRVCTSSPVRARLMAPPPPRPQLVVCNFPKWAGPEPSVSFGTAREVDAGPHAPHGDPQQAGRAGAVTSRRGRRSGDAGCCWPGTSSSQTRRAAELDSGRRKVLRTAGRGDPVRLREPGQTSPSLCVSCFDPSKPDGVPPGAQSSPRSRQADGGVGAGMSRACPSPVLVFTAVFGNRTCKTRIPRRGSRRTAFEVARSAACGTDVTRCVTPVGTSEAAQHVLS